MRSSISDLPDDLVIKILSFLSIKDAGATRVLSKRWRYLWSLVRRRRLKLDVTDHKRFEKSINNLLTLYESHVIESLYFKLSALLVLWEKKIGPWIKTGVHHHHCHLREIEVDACIADTQLPYELFTCKTLVVLKLKGLVIDVEEPLTTVSLPSLRTLHLDLCRFDYRSFQMLLSNCNLVIDLMAMRRSSINACEFDLSWCKSPAVLKLEGLIDVSISSSSSYGLPSLKTLHISRGKNLRMRMDCFCQFLSNCPLLSDLTVEKETVDAMLNLDFTLPALKRLSIITEEVESSTHLISLLNNYSKKFGKKIAPCFNYLNIQERNIFFCFSPSVSFRSPTNNFEDDASIFPRIVYLEMILSQRSEAMLVDLLFRCIKLMVLKLNNVKKASLYRWNPPSFVPECLLSSLEAFEWKGYTWIEGDMKLVSYLFNHALCLKTSKIFYDSHNEENEQRIVNYLASLPRGSRTCQLVLEELVD